MRSVMRSRTELRFRRLLHLLSMAAASLLVGCTHVKFSQQNPQTGEVWTVHEHTFGSDTVSYCPAPVTGGSCRRARMLDDPPAVSPAAWGNPNPAPLPGTPFPGNAPPPQSGQPPFGLPLPPGWNLPPSSFPFPQVFPPAQ
jgi:hypothetical protein